VTAGVLCTTLVPAHAEPERTSTAAGWEEGADDRGATSVTSIRQEGVEMTFVVAGSLRTQSYPAAVDVRYGR
jgi:hypothetical protein